MSTIFVESVMRRVTVVKEAELISEKNRNGVVQSFRRHNMSYMCIGLANDPKYREAPSTNWKQNFAILIYGCYIGKSTKMDKTRGSGG